MKFQVVSFFLVFCVFLVSGEGDIPQAAVKIIDCLNEGPCALHDGTVATFISDFVIRELNYYHFKIHKEVIYRFNLQPTPQNRSLI
jgi:hypothetical protein